MTAELEDEFWQAAAWVQQLIQSSRSVKQSLKMSEDKFDEHFQTVGIQVDWRPKSRNIRRLHNGEQEGVRKLRQYTGWLVGLVVLLREPTRRQQVGPETAGAIDRLAEEFEKYVKVAPDVLVLGGPRPPPSQREATFASLLGRYLFIREDQLIGIGSCFFDADKPVQPAPKQEACFNMYRYHSRQGFIAKSFTSIIAPTDDSRACTFANFFLESPSESTPRRAGGLILPMGKVLHFIGVMDRGEGLKVMTMLRPARPKAWYGGLLMSFDDYAEPIASRFVMKETSARTHTEAGIGIKSAGVLRSEIAEFDNELRNSIGDASAPDLAGMAALSLVRAAGAVSALTDRGADQSPSLSGK